MLVALPFVAVHACIPCQRAGPSTPAAHAAWLADLQADRNKTLTNIQWKGGVFDVPELAWTQDAYIQPQMHPYDRYFYDPDTGNYTVDRFLADLKTRYGGIDALLMWPTYTNIGIDDRNQFDFFRTMPGGLAGVARVTRQLKAAGVRVLWPYNPWDTGTRREAIWRHEGDDSDARTFANLLSQTGADGFNGDTMGYIPKSFWDAALAKKYPLAFEPEGGGSDESLNWHTMGWGYWSFPRIPQVDRFKFLSRGKFLTNVCARWATNKTDNLQAAWFNGAGYESWENVWGTWNGIVPRDAEAIRRVATLLRFFGGKARVLHSSGWVPHTPAAVQPHVYASEWPADEQTKFGIRRLWTIVNRAGQTTRGPQLVVTPTDANSRYYDCARGVPLSLGPAPPSPPPPSTPTPAAFVAFDGTTCHDGSGCKPLDKEGVAIDSLAACAARCDADADCGCVTWQAAGGAHGGRCWKRAACVPYHFEADAAFSTYVSKKRTPLPTGPQAPPASAKSLSFEIEAEGYGCVLEMSSPADVGSEVAGLLSEMAKLSATPLADYGKAWQYLPMAIVPIALTPKATSPPKGTVYVPLAPAYRFVVSGLEIEGDDNHGVDVQFPWDEHSHRSHDHTLSVGPFYMDATPVTNARYAEYVAATGYAPRDTSGTWLRPWNGSATPPAAIAQSPVTYVSLKEARLFCAWAGGRLPHTWEWQYAAQGADAGRLYPWGNDKDKAGALPAFHQGNTHPGPDAVGAHSPAGDSPFGVADMVGNVWQYTSEFRDAHTRSVLLRGGSNYRPTGSGWYFPNAPELNTHNKYFLFSDEYERAGTVGFRCVVDA